MLMKKRIGFRLICVLLSFSVIVSVFSACGKTENGQGAYKIVTNSIIDTCLLASNSDFELHWKADARAIVLKAIANDRLYSDILYENFLEGSTSANGNSTLNITVYNTKTLKTNTIRSYSELQNDGKLICKKIENGIRVSYFFDNYKLIIPVDYILRDDSLEVCVDSSKIVEDGSEYKLVSISLTPFLCSTRNDSENGYLLVPTGSGALMYTKALSDGAKKYMGEVYGDDAARQNPQSYTDETNVKLPVFGASGSGSGILGIIEQGDGAAVIEAQAGNDALGFSNAYATFYVRGYDIFRSDSYAIKEEFTTRFSENISGRSFKVGYYPLFGDDASYSGMAEKYREYLTENKLLNKSESEGTPYSLTMLGGTNIVKSFFGIPYKKLVPLTTFSKALSIIEDAKENTGFLPTVRMQGFGESGLRAGKVAGGNKYSAAYGNTQDINSLQKLFGKETASIYMDSEIVYFSKSSAGFSLSSDTAKTAILKRITHSALTPTRIEDIKNTYNVLARDRLSDAAEFAIKKAKKYGNSAISFSTLGSVAFSDYDSIKYDNKNMMAQDVAEILSGVRKSGLSVAVANANGYAAGFADELFDIPTDNGGYNCFDCEVPFYQMVFHSYKPMYSEAVNLSENAEKSVVKAIAYGMGIGFTVTDSYVADSVDLDEYRLYGTVYDDSREFIKKYIADNKYSELYEIVKDSILVRYTMQDNGVSVTEYSNGVKVYTNHNADKAECSGGTLEAYSFVVEKE